MDSRTADVALIRPLRSAWVRGGGGGGLCFVQYVSLK